MTVTVTKIVETVVIAGIVTEKGSVTKSVIAIVTVIVKEKESRRSLMVNTHSTTTRIKWTTTTWRWWIEVRSVDLLFQFSINRLISIY